METFNLMRNVGIEDVPEIDSNSWFKRSYSLLTFSNPNLNAILSMIFVLTHGRFVII